MKTKYLLLWVSLGVWACATNPTAGKSQQGNDHPKPDPFVQNELLAKSMNLGNALEAPNEGDWGIVLKAAYFETIASKGFTAIRIPCRFSAHTAAEPPFTINPDFMDRVVWAVDQAQKNNLAAIIDMHHYLEIFTDPNNEKIKFLSMWKQIATHFAGYSTGVLFEVLNEPHDQLDAETWNSFLGEAIDTIRSVDSLHTLIIGTADWGGISAMNGLLLPEDERNLIFTYHYYDPFHFTHQGAEWVNGSNQWLGTKWQGTSDEKSKIILDFFQVKAWAQAHKRPVFLGEFGAFHKADMASRIRWTSFVVQTAQADSISWAYWEFASGFGVYDPQTDSWREGLLNALIP